MAWGKPPGEEVVEPVNVAEERIREIVRDELAIIAAKNLIEVPADASIEVE